MTRIVYLWAIAILLAATGGLKAESVSLTGAGATFPYPLYSKWMSEYQRLHPEVRMNYQSIGSGGGIKQITEKTVDFGATDGPMSDEQLKKLSGPILHIPMTMGAVVPVYNLPQLTKPLHLTGPVLADLFLGNITKWNDPKIAAINPGVALPDVDVTIVHRSDGSGTSYIWTDYLTKVSKNWATGPGKGTSIKWPVGIGGKGNEGVTGVVKQTPGTLGYVELIYALSNNMPFGDVQNKAGKFVTASLGSVSAAAAGAISNMPEDLRVSITDAEGDASYPISGMTWLLVYKDQTDPAKGKALADFLWWAVHDGQAFSESLHYSKLPPELVKLCEKKIRSVTAGGSVLLSQKGE